MTAPDDSAIIDVRGVTKIYRRGGETLVVLDALDLHIPRGGFVALMGPSGSGKSTLLNLIGGLDRGDAGSVRVCGSELTQLSTGKLADWRAAHVGFVFQGFNLLPVLNAQSNVELPLLLTRLSRGDRKRRARAALALVGLEDRRRHRPSQLSGGQEQRVAIARALVSDPELILADEPTGNLDRESADSVMALLAELNAGSGKTILMVTHDPRAAAAASTVVHLDKGQLGRIETGAQFAASQQSLSGS